jgi:hypothetical protein
LINRFLLLLNNNFYLFLKIKGINFILLSLIEMRIYIKTIEYSNFSNKTFFINLLILYFLYLKLIFLYYLPNFKIFFYFLSIFTSTYLDLLSYLL